VAEADVDRRIPQNILGRRQQRGQLDIYVYAATLLIYCGAPPALISAQNQHLCESIGFLGCCSRPSGTTLHNTNHNFPLANPRLGAN